jgi:hypothetical protein
MFFFRRLISAVPRASGPFFMFCAPGVVFGGTEGVGSCFHFLCARIHIRRYRGRQVPFLCCALPDSFSGVPRASIPVVMLSAPGLVFCGSEGVKSRFHVFRSRTCFRRCRVRRVPFSCFARPESFSAVSRASCPVFLFLCSRTRFRPYRGRPFPFSCFSLSDMFLAVTRASGSIFGGTVGVRSLFFARLDSFLALLWASGPVFIFCTP